MRIRFDRTYKTVVTVCFLWDEAEKGHPPESQRAIPTILSSTAMKGEPRVISLSSQNVRFFLHPFKDLAFISRG